MATNKNSAETLVLMIPVKRQLLRDLLCTAVEGGSNYWADFADAERTTELDYLRVKIMEQARSDNQRPPVNRYVSADDLHAGLERLGAIDPDSEEGIQFSAAHQHLADALSGNHDATTADVVLQMTVFGELVYS